MTDPVSKPLSIDTGVSGESWGLSSRFNNIQVIGYGGSSVVLSADDANTNQKVAIKKLSFTDVHVAQRALREVRLLKRLNHDNIVQILDLLDASGSCLKPVANDIDTKNIKTEESLELPSICIIEELLDADLHQIIRSDLLNPTYAKLFLYQTLRGLKYIHSANVIHRDLKPSNLLVDCQTLTLKISDFGLCRVLDPSYDHSGHLTERVGTCWYVSPEQMLTPRTYTCAVDMWAAGCVFAEMLLGRPLFTGANEFSQMLLILDSIHLEEEDWGRVLRFMPNKMLKNHPFRPRTPFGERFTDLDPQALDLLEKLLTFDPANRITASDALKHPYLAEYRQREPRAQMPLSVEYEVFNLLKVGVEPSSPRSLQTVLIEEALLSSPAVQCGCVLSPAESVCSSPRDQQDSRHVSFSGSQNSLCEEDTGHDTHTLDEILQLRDNHPSTQQLQLQHSPRAGSLCSNSSSVDDLNARNLRQSQENLHHVTNTTTHSGSNGSGGTASIHATYQQQQQLPHSTATTGDPDWYAIYDAVREDCAEAISEKETEDTRNDLLPVAKRQEKKRSAEKSAKNKAKENERRKKNTDESDEDEKEVAEPSLKKIVEDEELLTDTDGPVLETARDTEEVFIDTVATGNQNLIIQNAVTLCNKYADEPAHYTTTPTTLTAENRNLPAGADQSSVTSGDRHHSGARSKQAPGSITDRRHTELPQQPNTDYDEDFAKEKKLLEYENERYVKLETDNMENEKNKRRRNGRHHHNHHHHNSHHHHNRPRQNSGDLDEMYRLPTEHLHSYDRDYSNERLRHKMLSKVTRQVFSLYRDGGWHYGDERWHDLNERLREANLDDGAVGGIDLTLEELQRHHAGNNTNTNSATCPVAAASVVESVSARRADHIISPSSNATTPRLHSPNNHLQRLSTGVPVHSPPPSGGRSSLIHQAASCHVDDVILTTSPREQQDLMNHQRVAVASIHRQQQQQRATGGGGGGRGASINHGDGFSSPEDNPSSPRASFSCGARPKRSPRKQKAL